MNTSGMRDMGAYSAPLLMDGLSEVIAGAGLDGAEQDGDILASATYISPAGVQRFFSGKVVYAIEMVGGDTKTFIFEGKLTHGDESNLSDETTLASVASATIFTAATGALRGKLCVAFDVDLSAIKTYFRASFKMTCSAASADTADVLPMLLLGGAADNPPSTPAIRTEAT